MTKPTQITHHHPNHRRHHVNPNQVDPSARGTTVIAADGETRGHLTGGSRDCDLESCGGKRLATRWDNGKLTYPCTKGMEWQGNAWSIL